MAFTSTVMIFGALFIGFVAGLLAFKVKLRWCPACGAALRCAACIGQPTPFEVRESLRRGGRR